ncbi:hypothetical protein HYFRA_00013778 [Hymenoscyphus fraxineus]|uniref:Saccharopine dehydrogenase NADP binding domain-containing protein n=1 Tax=Hymenoscyphus fraxineus TaxID=746836 RepID=A0A9N9LD68_9HELO|nr:hypothetical protein HYFRA_00013778 [Hymenoscyphus fraxineus]
MTGKLLIYGATGYTGTLISTQAKLTNLNFTIAGRSPKNLTTLSKSLSVPFSAFALDNHSQTLEHLKSFTAVLNCAGPFINTAPPLMRACIELGIHYLDITAEYKTYSLAESLHRQAKERGSMLLPGVGWDVVPSDCLALHTLSLLHGKAATKLSIALKVDGGMSRGSAISAGEIMGVGILQRRGGEIVSVPDAKTRVFDFGDGKEDVECHPISFGDLITAFHSTAIENIEMYVHVTGTGFPEGDLSELPDGPSEEERGASRAVVVVEVVDEDGKVFKSRIETVNGYSYTPLAAVEAARRVLGGEFRAGFSTPGLVFGKGFAGTIPRTQIFDV